MVQLEYWLSGECQTVVRYDHDGEGVAEQAHDAEEEGLHMDVYRDGERVDTEQVTGPIPADEAFNYAEEHLTAHLEQYAQRFELWHRIRSQ